MSSQNRLRVPVNLVLSSSAQCNSSILYQSRI